MCPPRHQLRGHFLWKEEVPSEGGVDPLEKDQGTHHCVHSHQGREWKAGRPHLCTPQARPCGFVLRN